MRGAFWKDYLRDLSVHNPEGLADCLNSAALGNWLTMPAEWTRTDLLRFLKLLDSDKPDERVRHLLESLAYMHGIERDG